MRRWARPVSPKSRRAWHQSLRDNLGCRRPRRSPARPVCSCCLAQQGGKTDGGLLPGSLPDQALFGSCTKPDLRAVLIGLQHPSGHDHRIQTTSTAAGNNADCLLVLARANWRGFDCSARPPEHTGDAVHRIIERQGDKQVDLIDVLPHQLGHNPDQTTTTPTHRAKSSKLFSQDLVLALLHASHPHQSIALPGRHMLFRSADHVDAYRSKSRVPASSHPDQAGDLTCQSPEMSQGGYRAMGSERDVCAASASNSPVSFAVAARQADGSSGRRRRPARARPADRRRLLFRFRIHPTE